jgi:micrococcal nuclease
LKSKTRFKSKNSKFKLVIVAIFLFGLIIGLAGGYFLWHADSTPQMEQALVARVIDGDTIELADGRHVRYLGIDTPETGEPYANEATAKNKQLVEGKIIELQQGKRDQDEYGRLLRYVYVDGVFVNAELVAQGYATAYIFDPDDRYSQVLVQLEQYAKMREQGLWAID